MEVYYTTKPISENQYNVQLVLHVTRYYRTASSKLEDKVRALLWNNFDKANFGNTWFGKPKDRVLRFGIQHYHFYEGKIDEDNLSRILGELTSVGPVVVEKRGDLRTLHVRLPFDEKDKWYTKRK